MITDFDLWQRLNTADSVEDATTLINQNASLDFVELYVSDKCQLNCLHCMPAGASAVETELSVQQWDNVIEQFISLGVRHFHIAGREPFYNDKSLEVVKYLNLHRDTFGLKYGIITNGIAVAKYFSQINQLRVDYLDFSLDGTRASHEFLRGKHTYDLTVKGIEQALQVIGRKRVYVSTVAFQNNLHEIPHMIEDLSELGVNKFFIQPLMPYGNAKNIVHLIPSPSDFNSLVERCIDLLGRMRKKIGVIFYAENKILEFLLKNNSFALSAAETESKGGQAIVNIGNSVMKFRFGFVPWAFWRSCVITPDGYYVGACSMRSTPDFAEHSVGNVKKQPIAELFDKSLNKSVLFPNVITQLLPPTD